MAVMHNPNYSTFPSSFQGTLLHATPLFEFEPDPPVHTVRFPGKSFSVLFSSEKRGPCAKERVVKTLLGELTRLEAHHGEIPANIPPFFSRGPLGQPLLHLRKNVGPHVSFTYDENQIWASISTQGHVGIDVASPVEFMGYYPYARAFRGAEFRLAKGFCEGYPQRAAALLWSLKEATVKAFGCGFNLMAPLDIEAKSFRLWEKGLLFEMKAKEPVSAWARPLGQAWLAIALIES